MMKQTSVPDTLPRGADFIQLTLCEGFFDLFDGVKRAD